MERERAEAWIRSHGPAAWRDATLALLRPSARLRRERTPLESLPLGASRLGGAPDLPPGYAWPSRDRARRVGFWRRRVTESVPLDFLAQIRLSDLPEACLPTGLPGSGWLYFFFDVSDQAWSGGGGDASGSRVLLWDGPAEALARTAPPRPGAACCALRADEDWTLQRDPPWLDGVADEEWIEEVWAPVCEGEEIPLHRMFGDPQAIQDTAEISGAHLLLQLDTDDEVNASPGWMWGDAGRLYFLLDDEALARRDVAAARCILQCH